jgi:tRNA(Arg) A34 adenosine deaminase TadA
MTSLSNKHDRVISNTFDEALLSPCSSRHGCVAAINGKIIARGPNNYRQHSHDGIMNNPFSCHAEMDVLRKCLQKVSIEKMKKITFYVTRVTCDGQIKNSAPCADCLQQLQKYNIKRIIYSTDDATFVSIKQTEYKTNFRTRCRKNCCDRGKYF